MSITKPIKFNYLKNILVPQHTYLGRKGNVKILIKNFLSLKYNIGAALYCTYDPTTVAHKTYGQNI